MDRLEERATPEKPALRREQHALLDLALDRGPKPGVMTYGLLRTFASELVVPAWVG